MPSRSPPPNPIRDSALLDALERLPQRPFSGTVWRSVGEGRDPLACHRSGGRWDDGSFDVLYTSTARDVAVAERRFHLYAGQPIPPSKMRYALFELSVSLEATVTLADLEALRAIGMDTARYGQPAYAERAGEYPRSQQIAETCSFLGADGLFVPNARHDGGLNLVIFCEQGTEIEMTVRRDHGIVDFR